MLADSNSKSTQYILCGLSDHGEMARRAPGQKAKVYILF